jgi:hypothetical protein
MLEKICSTEDYQKIYSSYLKLYNINTTEALTDDMLLQIALEQKWYVYIVHNELFISPNKWEKKNGYYYTQNAISQIGFIEELHMNHYETYTKVR